MYVTEAKQLSAADLEQLHQSGLTNEQAKLTGHFTADAAIAKELTGHELPGLIFTYLDPHGQPYRCGDAKWLKKQFCRLKPDWSQVDDLTRQRYRQKHGELPKYLSPGKVGNRPYFSRLTPNWPDICDRPSISFDITEGEKKADSGCANGFPVIGLSGVTCCFDSSPRDEWLQVMGSEWDVDTPEEAPNTSRFLPELEQIDRDAGTGVIDWRFRDVGIVFDSDIVSKVPVQRALEKLSAHVRARDGQPFPILLPNESDGSKNGLDDFLKRHGPKAYAELRTNFLQLQRSSYKMLEFKPPEAVFTLKEPPSHVKSLMAWSVLKESWAYRPSVGWYEWTGNHWRLTSDPANFEQALTRFMDAQGWLVRSGNLLSYMGRDIRNRVLIPEHEWGAEYLLGFKNGVLDLRDNTFSPHSPKHFITSILPYDYDPLAKCPTWLNYLSQVTNGDDKLIGLLQAWCKWIVSPKAKNQKAAIEKSLDLVGRKGSGKSTFLDVLYQLVGEGNYGDATPDTFASPVGLGQLLDKKLAVDADASGFLCQVGVFNKVVSNEPVTVKKLFRDTATLRLGVVVVRAYNDYPSVPSSGAEGLDRRLCVIPFRHPPKQVDVTLSAKLRAEMPGIFAWCWQLPAELMERRILNSGAIEAVQSASIERFEADHPEFRFLKNAFPYGYTQIQAFNLFQQYVEWCKANNHRPVSNTNFGRIMNEYPFRCWQGDGGCRFYEIPPMLEFDIVEHMRIRPKDLPDCDQEPANADVEPIPEGSEGYQRVARGFESGSNADVEPIPEGSEGLSLDCLHSSHFSDSAWPAGDITNGDRPNSAAGEPSTKTPEALSNQHFSNGSPPGRAAPNEGDRPGASPGEFNKADPVQFWDGENWRNATFIRAIDRSRLSFLTNRLEDTAQLKVGANTIHVAITDIRHPPPPE